jgi:folate-binding protein YgfZ
MAPDAAHIGGEFAGDKQDAEAHGDGSGAAARAVRREPCLGNRATPHYLIVMTFRLDDRAVIAVSGPEARDFLQGLITNDMKRVTPDALAYAAILTPQGKILFDFLIGEQDGTLLLDAPAAARDALVKRLTLYRLRAKVEIAARDDLAVTWTDNAGAPFLSDPRHRALGFRAFLPKADAPAASGSDTFRTLRLKLGVPEGHDFGQDKMFALDSDLDELHGIAFDKGCYVGQELTARMKHRGTARKRLLPVVANATLPDPEVPVTAAGREIGTLQSIYDTQGFALLRLDRLEDADTAPLDAGGVAVHVAKPDWLFS